MNVLVILVPVSLFLACLAFGLFVWTMRNEQYDDLEGDAYEEAMEAAMTGDANQSQLPTAYSDPATSDLVVEISTDGAEEITLELQDPS